MTSDQNPSHPASVVATEKKGFTLDGMPWPSFIALSVAVAAAAVLGILPRGIAGALPFLIVIGTLLHEIGARTPIIRSYLGGGSIVTIFGSAALVYFGVLDQEVKGVIDHFLVEGDFLDFFIAAMLSGSILGMNRSLLIHSAIRYIPAIFGAVACALGLAYAVGRLIGYGGDTALFFVAIPIMGGGIGAGAVPMSQIFAEQSGKAAQNFLSIMLPAVALGNALSIVAAALLDRLGKARPTLSGNGQLLRHYTDDGSDAEMQHLREHMPMTAKNLGIGLFIATSFFCFGGVVGKYIPAIHPYAWMILLVAAIKIFALFTPVQEARCYQWYQFVSQTMTKALLVGVGVTYTDLGHILASLNAAYLILVGVTVAGAIAGGAVVGYFVGLYRIEAAITAGLCMSCMGGGGNIAVLSASNRMELLPFGQVSSRLGGAFMLMLANLLVHVLGFAG